MSIYINNLRQTSILLKVNDVAEIVLSNPRFSECPASAKAGCHHYEIGGLARHTWEVWEMAEIVLGKYAKSRHHLPDSLQPEQELYLACLYHDVGKMWDYEEKDSVWQSAHHKRIIHHISRSGIEWSRAVDQYPLYRPIEEDVLHAILAHHGQRAWGSPVAPLSRLAWMVHLCDGISARMDDADTLDTTKVNK